jgi:hypothetical protein
MDDGTEADNEGDGEEYLPLADREKPLSERVQYWNPVGHDCLANRFGRYSGRIQDRGYAELDGDHIGPVYGKGTRAAGLGTRLTMTSRTGFFNDRIISPSMMRAMAIC